MLITLPRQVTSATATHRLPTAAELPYSDGVPLETSWHTFQMLLLKISIEFHWRGRKDFYCGGDMFMYFSEERVFNKDFRGPDFFVVKGVDHDRKRLSWVSWEEGDRLPDVIIELLSPSTRKIDRTEKKKLYDETFHTAEYFCFDPQDGKLEGWRRNGGGYIPIERDDNGRLWSKQMEVSFEWWTGSFANEHDKWVRMSDIHGKMVPTFDEAAEANLQAANARAEAEAEAQAATVKALTTRADKAEAELEELRKELDALRQQSAKPTL